MICLIKHHRIDATLVQSVRYFLLKNYSLDVTDMTYKLVMIKR